MRPIIYDFAMTLDGYICREDGSIEGFTEDEEHVPDYFARLEQYDAVLMGRATYEFGYQYGIKPGARAYPHMEHYIVSSTLQFESSDLNIVERNAGFVRELKNSDGGAIYLCGGGQLAGWLLEEELIDRLVIKLNPVFLGSGIRAFGDSRKQVHLVFVDSKTYDNGVVLLRYDVKYGP